MRTKVVKRWNIYCNSEADYIEGFLNEDDGTPSVCFNNNGHSIDTSKTELLEIIENTYTLKVIKWKVYCSTELQDVYGYLNAESGTPTKCFNNSSHTISTVTQVEVINNVPNR